MRRELPLLKISRPLVILLHVLVWTAMIGIPLFFLFRDPIGILAPRFAENMDLIPAVSEHKLFSVIKSNILLIILFYLNEYVMIPEILKKRGVGQYILVAASCLLISAAIDNLLTHWIMVHTDIFDPHFIIIHLLPMIFVMAISSTFALLSDKQRAAQNQKDLETQRLSSELSFLRSQVSPHFMFNVLNSIIALARKKSDALEPVVIKLSNLLRYMLYESDDHKINLTSEIEYLKSYIDLQKMRFGEDVNVHLEIEEPPEDYDIEPMLLIPFVENAFKHGVGLIINPVIHIKLKLQQKRIQFFVSNKFNARAKETKDKNSGIGLHNVERRLNLLYPETHTLRTNQADNWYSVELDLKLE